MVHAAVLLLVLAVLGSSRAEVLDGIDLDAAADMFAGEAEEGDSTGNVETFKVSVKSSRVKSSFAPPVSRCAARAACA